VLKATIHNQFVLIFSFLIVATSGYSQNEGAERTKLPVSARIQGRIVAQSGDRIGNVIVTYSDGTEDQWSLKGNCGDPKVSANGTVGWEVYQLNPDEKSLKTYNGLYINDHLAVCFRGKIVASLASGKAFIEGWAFTQNGVVIKSRGAHGPAVIELFSLHPGPPLASVWAYAKHLPAWAEPFADTE
jgi:hypothetical protein